MTGALVAAGLAVAAVAGARGTWSPCGLSMISAINPLSERSRGNRFALTAGWFVFGSVLGGLLLGSAAGLLAGALRPLADHPAASLWAGVVACLVALAADRRVAGFQLPLHPRQVNELWLTQYRRWLYAAGFGVQIGIGFATYIMTAATYLVLALAVLTGSPAQAVAIGATFGLVRGLAVLLSARCRTRAGAAAAAPPAEPARTAVAAAGGGRRGAGGRRAGLCGGGCRRRYRRAAGCRPAAGGQRCPAGGAHDGSTRTIRTSRSLCSGEVKSSSQHRDRSAR